MEKRKNKRTFGPGFLVAAAFIGPGTVTSCSLAGARFGYALIYALVFATVTTIILQEMTGRLSLASGKDFGECLRELSKSPLTRLLFTGLTLSAITLGCAAYEAGNIIGGALGLQLITSLPRQVWVIIITAVAIAVLSLRKYHLIEKFLMVLVLTMSLAFLATALIIRPDPSAILKGLIPSLPSNSMMLTLALVGTTVVPYNLFLHSSAAKAKWKHKDMLGNLRYDLLISVGLGGAISVAIIVTSAATFFAQGVPVQDGMQMARQLQPLFGGFTNILFGLGFFAAGMSSAITAPYAAAFASAGVFGWDIKAQPMKFHMVWIGVILTGFTVSMFGFNPISVIIFAQIANGLILPIASILLLIIMNDRKRMGPLVNNWIQNLFGGVVTLIVSFLGIWNIVKLFLFN